MPGFYNTFSDRESEGTDLCASSLSGDRLLRFLRRNRIPRLDVRACLNRALVRTGRVPDCISDDDGRRRLGPRRTLHHRVASAPLHPTGPIEGVHTEPSASRPAPEKSTRILVPDRSPASVSEHRPAMDGRWPAGRLGGRCLAVHGRRTGAGCRGRSAALSRLTPADVDTPENLMERLS